MEASEKNDIPILKSLSSWNRVIYDTYFPLGVKIMSNHSKR